MVGCANEDALNSDGAFRRAGRALRLSNAALVQLVVSAQFTKGNAQALLTDVDLVSTHKPDHRDARRMVEADIALGDMSVCFSLDADQLGSDPIRQKAIIWHAT